MQAGDALCFSAVLSTRHKPWAEKLIPPYALFFGLGCVASLISILSHTTFCFDKLRSRHFGGGGGGPNAMSIEELRMKDALDHNRFETPRALFLNKNAESLLGQVRGTQNLYVPPRRPQAA